MELNRELKEQVRSVAGFLTSGPRRGGLIDLGRCILDDWGNALLWANGRGFAFCCMPFGSLIAARIFLRLMILVFLCSNPLCY